MGFKMYGQYKYDLNKESYFDSDGNSLLIEKNGNRWIAKFSKNNKIIETFSFEELDRLIEEYLQENE